MAKKRVLIVDDEESIRFGMRSFLEAQGYHVSEADCVEKAKEVFDSCRPDVAVLDYRLHDGNALDLLRIFKQADADVPLIVLTAYGSIELAVEAVKEGAEQFLTKPINLTSLLVVIQRLLEGRRVQRKQQASVAREVRNRIDPFYGTSLAIKKLADRARKVMTTESSILLLGETGTGTCLHGISLRVIAPARTPGLALEFASAKDTSDRARRDSAGLAQREVDPSARKQRMPGRIEQRGRRLLERHHPVKAKAVHPAPHDHVAVLERHAHRPFAAQVTAEEEHRGHAQRNGHDGEPEIPFVAVLVQRQPGAGQVAVDQAGVRRKSGEARQCRRLLRQAQEHVRHRRPALPGNGILLGVAIAAAVAGPAEVAAVGQGHRHGQASRDDHVPKRRLYQNGLQCGEEFLRMAEREPVQQPGLRPDPAAIRECRTRAARCLARRGHCAS